mgnify:CR=1 FL=1
MQLNVNNSECLAPLVRKGVALLTTVVLILLALVLFSAWHRHDKKAGTCNFNHLDSLQAETAVLAGVAALRLPFCHLVRMEPSGRGTRDAQARAVPRSPPV